VAKFDIFATKKALFSRLLENLLVIQLSKTRIRQRISAEFAGGYRLIKAIDQDRDGYPGGGRLLSRWIYNKIFIKR